MLVIGVNPGDGVMCPWLSHIATNFKHYKINKMTISYNSSVSSFTNGAIAVAPTYDPDDLGSSVLTVAEIMTREGAMKGNIWDDFTIPLKPMKSSKLVRSKALTAVSGEHLRQTDHALLNIALYNIQNIEDVNSYGDLLVSYDVTLTTPAGSRSNAKCHRITATDQNIGAASQFPPLFIRTDDALDHSIDYTTNPFYNHHAENVGHAGSTLAVRCRTGKIGTAGPNEVVANRFVFDEPFTGRLTIDGYHDDAGSAEIPRAIVEGTTTLGGTLVAYESNKRPLSRAAIVKSTIPEHTANNTDFTAWFDLVAKAGDVLDLVMSGVKMYNNAHRTLTWTELAPELIEAALL
jgi:hypothetical protein